MLIGYRFIIFFKEMEDESVATKSTGTQSFFPRTSWTRLSQMSEGEDSTRAQAWEEFFQLYFACLVKVVQQKGVEEATAQDIVQTTFVRIWKSDSALACLSPERGKLRSYLLNATLNNLRDYYRKMFREKRGGGQSSLNIDELESEYVDASASSLEYDSHWAVQTCSLALELLRREYLARDKGEVFARGIPFLDQQEPERRVEVAEELGLSVNTFTVALKRLRERLASRLRDVVASTLYKPSPSEVDEELRELMQALPKGLDLATLADRVSLSGDADVIRDET